jgi:hypothetical protein
MSEWARLAILVMLFGAATPLIAQRAGFSLGTRPGFTVAPRAPGLTISFHANPTGSFQRFPWFTQGFYGSPFFYPDVSYPPALTQVGPPASQVIFVQPIADTRHQESLEDKPAQLLLFERRGDRFVRIRESEPESGLRSTRATDDELEASSRNVRSKPAVLAGPELPPVVLVFRDGRREEIGGYTIATGILYVSSNYWQTGAWTKRVQLSSLDLPATLRENEARGSKFMLPSGPYEVIVRP